MSPPSINPNSLKIRLAYRFLRNLNNLNSKTSNFTPSQIQRSRRVKIAAYASMAHVTGSRRAWSRAILRKIRIRRLLARKKRVDLKDLKNTRPRHHPRHVHARSTREFVDPIGDSSQEVKLRKLVPGSSTMDACGLLDETADYIKCLATQVEVMRTLVDFYSTF